MKVKVITLTSVRNYGTQLQALATQAKLKEYFDNVSIINYRRPDTYGKKLIKTFSHGNPIKAIAVLPTVIKWHFTFDRFQRKHLRLTSRFTDADIYFTGSDQVWNTGWNQGIIPELYLNFVPDGIPKYAFAASFGGAKIEQKYLAKTKQLLTRYTQISVREASGLNILRNQLNIKNGLQIIDPTLLMDTKFWRSYSSGKHPQGEYILIYNLNRNPDLDNYARALARKTGLPVYRFCTRYDQIFRYGKSLIIPEVLDFISYIDHAKYVLTDSFHATAFAINMNTQPICVYPEQYSSRISDFLQLVGAEKCHVKNYHDFSVLDYRPDFTKINQILNTERKKADQFLTSIKERHEK